MRTRSVEVFGRLVTFRNISLYENKTPESFLLRMYEDEGEDGVILIPHWVTVFLPVN